MNYDDFEKRIAQIIEAEPDDATPLAKALFAEMTADVFNPSEDDYDPKREELLRLAGELAVADIGTREEGIGEIYKEPFSAYWVGIAAAIITEVDRVSGAKVPQWDEEQEQKAFAEAEWTVFQKDAPDMSRENGMYKNPRVYEDWLLWCIARGAGQ